MDIFDVVMRLNGPVEPVGDSSVDRDRLENLKALCDLTDVLLERIQAVAEATDDHMASVKAAKDYAAEFMKALGVRELDGQALSGETLMDSVSRIPASSALDSGASPVSECAEHREKSE